MTNVQEAHERVYRNIIAYSAENTAIVTKLPGYTANIELLATHAENIQIASEEQKIEIKGVTNYKRELRNLLISLGTDNARKLVSYSKLTKDQVLLGKVKYTASDFKRFTDDELKDYTQIIYNCATPIIEDLTAYDINEETQTTFLNAITNFRDALVAPDLADTIRKQATKKLMHLFEAGDACVADLAAAVEIVRIKEPIFYLGFKTAQKLIVRGRVKIAINGHTTDANDAPLPGVTLTITLDGKIILVKKISKKGGFKIKSLATGAYQFTFTKAGFADQTVTVNVNEGELTRVKVKMIGA